MILALLSLSVLATVNAQVCVRGSYLCSGQTLQICNYVDTIKTGWIDLQTCNNQTTCSSVVPIGCLVTAAPAPKKANANKDVLASTTNSQASSPAQNATASITGAHATTSVVARTTAAASAVATTAAQVAVVTTKAIPSGSGGSTTSGGSSISIIQPLTGATIYVGQQLQITWALTGVLSNTFNNANLSFEIDDATNPNLVVLAPNGALNFTKQPIVGDLMATAIAVPNIAAGNAYTVKAIYKDTNTFVYWYSPTFSIKANPVVPATSTGTAVGTPVTPTKLTSGTRSDKLDGSLVLALLSLFFLTL
ncbi:hypothetical protein HDU98_004966 [Podochytrium sp. JEL0797]|nr:hypothetical protein HDU98_004966 [Podochytrium sp. JEL0797]